MKQILVATITLLVSFGSAWADGKPQSTRLFDVRLEQETTLAQLLPMLREKRIILVGEHHTTESHHWAQLQIIRALHESGVPVVIGLEMFRAEEQDALDSWVNGEMKDADFQKMYYDNWTFPWPLYSMIFEYSRERRIPMVGLNVPREITQQVAMGGFESLSKKDRGRLPLVTCRVDPEYMAFIKRAYGAHAHGQLNFTYFCEAQLVWDKAMAINALEFLRANPGVSMVLLAGTGHAWKKGIPEQIRQRSPLPYVVIFPGVPGHVEPGFVTEEDTDYIVLDLPN